MTKTWFIAILYDVTFAVDCEFRKLILKIAYFCWTEGIVSCRERYCLRPIIFIWISFMFLKSVKNAFAIFASTSLPNLNDIFLRLI